MSIPRHEPQSGAGHSPRVGPLLLKANLRWIKGILSRIGLFSHVPRWQPYGPTPVNAEPVIPFISLFFLLPPQKIPPNHTKHLAKFGLALGNGQNMPSKNSSEYCRSTGCVSWLRMPFFSRSHAPFFRKAFCKPLEIVSNTKA